LLLKGVVGASHERIICFPEKWSERGEVVDMSNKADRRNEIRQTAKTETRSQPQTLGEDWHRKGYAFRWQR